MKKKIICFLLACVMVLPLIGYQAGADSNDAKVVSVSSVPQRKDLETLLTWVGNYLGLSESTHEYDCRTAASCSSYNIFELLAGCPIGDVLGQWSMYPGKKYTALGGWAPTDPLNKFDPAYERADKYRIDWIVTNILNCSHNDLTSLRKRWETHSDLFSEIAGIKGYGYEHSGIYYSASLMIGDFGWPYTATIQSAKYDGTYYYVAYDYKAYPKEKSERYYATVGLKTIDGKTYWSIFANSAKGFVSFSSVAGFYDVQKSEWFANDVEYIVEKKLMNGTSDHYFTPNGKTTRAQAVTILYRLAGSPKVSGSGSFTDVKSGTWYSDAVQWAVKNGIASGYGDGRFGPNDTLNRQQLATMLIRYARPKNYDTKPSGDLSKFKDGNKVDSYAKTAMEWAVVTGLISGSSDGNLNPNGPATRAQLAAILHRFCENVTGTKATDTVLDKLLSKNPATGNKELALIAAELSLRTYDNGGSNDEGIKDYLTQELGFDNANIYSNNYGGSLAFTLATKPYKGSDSDGNTDILIIVARGSQTGYELYMDKFTQAKDSYQTKAYGSYRMYDIVKDFRNAIYEGLPQVIDPNKNYKVLVTGHSLGGAAANLVAAQIMDGYANADRQEKAVKIKDRSKDVFCYTFGAIDSIVTDGTVYKGYEGIHNVTNYYDSFGPNGWLDEISAAGNSRYGKFGHIDMFEKDIDKGTAEHKNHDMDTYRDAVRDGLVRFEKSSDQKYADLSGGGGGISGR